MLYTTLDKLVRMLLLKQGKPIHYYAETLYHALSGMQRLHTTTMRCVNSVRLTVNDHKAVTIPCDFADWTKVGFEAGERVRELIHDTNLNPRLTYDASNKAVPYPAEDCEIPVVLYYNTPNYYMDFGRRTDRGDYRFCVVPERNEIQLSAHYPFDYVLLDYISDGLRGDAATQIDTQAQPCLEKWILWQMLVHKRGVSDGERMMAEKRFNDEWRLLRSVKNNLTPAQVVQAVRSGYSALPRN